MNLMWLCRFLFLSLIALFGHVFLTMPLLVYYHLFVCVCFFCFYFVDFFFPDLFVFEAIERERRPGVEEVGRWGGSKRNWGRLNLIRI